jgi:DNA-binding transcriptional MerR regulator
MKLLDIAEIARRSGVPASTLRFYDEKGLIESAGRRGTRRLFDPGVLERLSLIALGRNAGFSLEEIGAMFAPDGCPRIDRAQLAAKGGELDRTIRKLIALRDGLLHAAECPAPTHMECPTFQRMLRLASAGQARRRRSAGRKVGISAAEGNLSVKAAPGAGRRSKLISYPRSGV